MINKNQKYDKDENQLMLDLDKLVISIAHKYNCSDPGRFDDLCQAGRIGLLKAIRKYDSTKAALTTFAYRKIQWEMLKELERQNKYIVRYTQNSAFSKRSYNSDTSWIDICDELSDDEKYVAIERNIYRRSGTQIIDEMNISRSKLKKIEDSIQYKMTQYLQK